MPMIHSKSPLCATRFALSGIVAEPTVGPDPDAVPVLSSRDYSLLREFARFCRSSDGSVGHALANTLDRCRVVPPNAVPSTVAVLGARVVFRPEGRFPECRVLILAQDDAQDGTTLTVAVPFGAALLGAAAGQALEVIGSDGRHIVLHLLAVDHDPGRLPATAMLPDRAESPVRQNIRRPDMTLGRGQARRTPMNEIKKGEALRPPLVLSAEDHTRLVALAGVMIRRNPLIARLLLEEADRAEVIPAAHVPPGIVAMGSIVEFRDAATGEERQVQVVLPGEADIAESRISILSLVGAGLIGLSEGQSIDWPTQDGRLRRLTILRVKPLSTTIDGDASAAAHA